MITQEQKQSMSYESESLKMKFFLFFSFEDRSLFINSDEFDFVRSNCRSNTLQEKHPTPDGNNCRSLVGIDDVR